MSAFGVILREGVLHATVFALVGIVIYLVLRRFSPAAGALGAASTLVVMAIVSALALSPWPRWGLTVTPGAIRVEGSSPEADLTAPGSRRPETPSPGEPGVAGSEEATGPAKDWQAISMVLLQALDREWTAPAPGEGEARGSWRNWLIVALLASIGLGLTRLATGAWAMRRLRLRSRRLCDDALIDTVEILRAEMSCLQPVELRTSAELATPATIGWRRTLILLPDDWRSWTEDERRAVLAHELAHVCRGDFFTGLLAQLSLALQFYHPLAHWLAARLRLEQELAADAWSARLSGGNYPYLTLLARMALRRDAPTLSWPARAFLPSRGTFVRRIEMLRHSKRIRHVGLSPRARFATVAAMLSLGLLVAGLRAPRAGTPSPAQVAGGAAPGAAGNEAPLAEKGSFDLTYLPPETRMFLALRPSLILSRPEMQPVLKLWSENPNLRNAFPLDPEQIDQILVFWEGMPEEPGRPGMTPFIPPPSGAAIRFKRPQDAKALLTQVLPGAEEVRHAGASYHRPNGPNAKHGPMGYLPDERTVFLAKEDLVRTHMEDRKAPAVGQPWNEAWSQVQKGQVAAVLDGRWFRRRFNQGFAGRAQPGQRQLAETKLDTISPLVEKVRFYAVGIDLDREIKVDAVAAVGSADDVKPVTETIQALLTLGKNAVPSLRATLSEPGALKETNERLVGALSSLVEKARVESTGQVVHLQSTTPLDLAEAARIVVSFLTEGREHAARIQSVNNLKQIGLAFHNYASQHNHLPPPVLYGGKSGKVPYSWRVAILPYLEQQEVYSAYNFDEPWDGPNNRKLLDKIPAIYVYPGPGGTDKTQTAYYVFSGQEALLGKGEKPGFADITDGMSNTLLVVEARRATPWTKPEDIPFDPQGPPPQLGGFTPDGFNAAFGDGSVRYIKKSIDPSALKSLITRAGGELIDFSRF